MAINLIKLDVTDLDYDARQQLLRSVIDKLHAQFFDQPDAGGAAPEVGYNQWTSDGTDWCGFAATSGKSWSVFVSGRIPAKPSLHGATLPVAQQLTVEVECHEQANRESGSDDEPSPVIWIGCLPALLVTLLISGGAVYRRVFLDSGDSNYLTTTQSRWMFIGGLIAGVVVLVVVALAMNFIALGLKKGWRRITHNQIDVDQLERDVAEKLDITKVDIGTLPLVE